MERNKIIIILSLEKVLNQIFFNAFHLQQKIKNYFIFFLISSMFFF